jgi:hypothetical protein
MKVTGQVLVPYELEREEIIARNRERMAILGVAESADRLRCDASSLGRSRYIASGVW